jgi:hypothetical protein
MRIWNMLRFRGALRRGARTGLAGIGLKAAARRLFAVRPSTSRGLPPAKPIRIRTSQPYPMASPFDGAELTVRDQD